MDALIQHVFSIQEDMLIAFGYIQNYDEDDQLISLYQYFQQQNKQLYPKSLNFLKNSSALVLRLKSILSEQEYVRLLVIAINSDFAIYDQFLSQNPIPQPDTAEITQKDLLLYEILSSEVQISARETAQIINKVHQNYLKILSNLKTNRLIQIQEEINALFEKDISFFSEQFKLIQSETLNSLEDQAKYLKDQSYEFFEQQNEAAIQAQNKIMEQTLIHEKIHEKEQKLTNLHEFIFNVQLLPQLLIHAKALQSTHFQQAVSEVLGQHLLDDQIRQNYVLTECELMQPADFELILHSASDQSIEILFQHFQKAPVQNESLELSSVSSFFSLIPRDYIEAEVKMRRAQAAAKIQQMSQDQLNMSLSSKQPFISSKLTAQQAFEVVSGSGSVTNGSIIKTTGERVSTEFRSITYHTIQQNLKEIKVRILKYKNATFEIGFETNLKSEFSFNQNGIVNAFGEIYDTQKNLLETDTIQIIIKRFEAQVFVNGQFMKAKIKIPDCKYYHWKIKVFQFEEEVEMDTQFMGTGDYWVE
ncbi:Conserved_hypothetical protein [Hexamita inflata]|uniref:Uncharacterized protein n=1 Tax=Hexamita inflata TaxID=28002 RepID=A0AA86RQJ3_9EUKA|nr:Conserved hypothetical protein [Hexamita inflata]